MSIPTSQSQAPGVRWRRLHRMERVLSSRPAGAAATCLTVLIILGCMTHNHYHSDPDKVVADVNSPLTQDGKIILRPGAEQIIYYPLAYAVPPNLELEDRLNLCEVLEQKENYFHVRMRTGTYSVGDGIPWKARGVRPLPPPPAPPLVTPHEDPPPPAPAKLIAPSEGPPPPAPVVIPGK